MDALFALPYGPFVIFAMRIVDVSLGTVRMIVMVRGQRALAAAIGFIEVLVWIVAVGNALQHLTSPYHIIGYAGGFAAGTYVGIGAERLLALGKVVVRAIVPGGDNGHTARALRETGYAVTEIDGRGREGPVDVLNAVVNRKEAPRVVETIEELAPRSFITVEELRTTRGGMLHPTNRHQPHQLRK
jgi:uncharacterized protein YebE (UPF0316 family)